MNFNSIKLRRLTNEFYPLLVLNIIAFISIIQFLWFNYLADYKFYLGVILLSINTFLYFKKRNLFTLVFIITLLLGVINLVSFSWVYLSLEVIHIKVQIIPFIILLIFFYILREDLIAYYRTPENEKQRNFENLKNRFKNNFENLSDKEINSKLNENLVPEAIEALKEIKSSRKNET